MKNNKKQKIKHKFFIENYENNVKKYRDEYYRTIITSSKTQQIKIPDLAFNLIPYLIAIIILLLFGFSISGYIISFICLIGFNVLVKVLSSMLNFDEKNRYLLEIRKSGFFSIEDYEDKIRKYITGSGGYYEIMLNDLIEKYNINDSTRKVESMNGDIYYIWLNGKQDKLNLLNTKCNIKPAIESIKVSNIRYYRVDNVKKQILLKTDIDEYYFKISALDILNDMIKSKKFDNLKVFTPEDYINDFEIFMHRKRDELNKDSLYEETKFSNNVSKLILCCIILFLLVGVNNIIDKYDFLFSVSNIILLFLIHVSFADIISYKRNKAITDEDYIDIINNDPECIRRFDELKISLNINNNYDRVYTPEKVCYLSWVANGYFHVFLNLIYFNVVYMAVKVSDVRYYQVKGKECLIKLKDKTLCFTKDASDVFAKLLPNKDYEWLKAYQSKR